VINLSEKIFV